MSFGIVLFVAFSAAAASGQSPVYRPSATPPVYQPKAAPSPTPSATPAMKPPVYTWATAETLTAVTQVTDVKPDDFWYKDLQILIEKFGIAGLTENKKFMPKLDLSPVAYRTIRQSGIVQLRTIASRTGMLNSRFDKLFPTNCPDPKAVGDVMSSAEVINSLKCIFGPATLKPIYPDKPMSRGYFVQVFVDALENGMSKISSNSSLGTAAGKPASPAEIKSLIEQGQRSINAKDYDQAIRYFNQVLDHDAENVDAYRFRGLAALMAYESNPQQSQKLYTALFNFDHVMKRNAANSDDYYLRGMTQVRLGSKDKAIADFRSALKMNPNHQGAKDELKKLGVTP